MIKNRILSLLLTIAICIPACGIFANADDGRLYPSIGKGEYLKDDDTEPDRLYPGQDIKIKTITVAGLKEPVHGASPDNNFTVEERGAVRQSDASYWVDMATGKRMLSTDTFQFEKMYEFIAVVAPESGYVFAADSDITASINGYAAKAAYGNNGTKQISYRFKCTAGRNGTLKEAYLYVDEPKVGEKPDEFSGTSTYDYYGDNVTWSPNDEVFKAGVSYTCTTFAHIDYFEGVFDKNTKVYINDKEAEIVEMTADLLKVRYTFPALPDEPAQPLEEVYLYIDEPKVGEKPAGLSATSTYDYVGDIVSWSPNDEVFKAGVAYTCTTFTRIKQFEGVFDDNVKVYINDKEAEILGKGADLIQVSYTFPALPEEPAQPLKEVHLYVDEPKVGEKPAERSASSTDDYVGDDVTWSPSDTVFKAGVAYTCTTFTRIKQFEGVFDDNVKVYINDKEAEIIRRGTDLLQVRYTFSALPEDVHTHSYKSAWKYDENSHWRECECGEQTDIAPHDFNNRVCAVCGYEKPGSDTDHGSDIKPDYKFPFIDVPDSAWFRGDVETAHKNGLVNGKTETLYCPRDLMTYAEAIKLAATMNQLYHEGKVTLKNGDAQWYSTYMEYALEKGIIAEDMSLQSDQSISRRDFVKIFRASLPSSEFPAINEVSDGKIPDVAMNADGAAQIYDFYRAGILVGSDTLGTFNPDSSILRSEVAAILTRMFDTTARKNITLK